MRFSPYSDTGGAASYKTALHWHTTNSDGVDTPAVMVAAHVAAGFDVAMCTDHDFITPDPGVGGILYIQGMERTVVWPAPGSHNSHIIEGNVSVVGPNDPQGAIDNAPYSHLAHPWSIIGPPVAYFTLAEMEGLTGYAGIEIDNPNAPYEWDNLLTDGYNVFGFYVSDAHAVATVNLQWVEVFASALTLDAVIDALNAGRFYATQGPLLDVEVRYGRKLAVSTAAASNFFFYGTGGGLLRQVNNATSAFYVWKGGEGYVRCSVTRVADGFKAFTNAVLLRA